LPRLSEGVAQVAVIGGEEDGVDIGGFNFLERGSEIGVAGAEGLFGDDFSAVSGEIIFEGLGEALGIIAGRVGEEGDAFPGGFSILGMSLRAN
jgi:hypothetical protein